MKFPWTKPPTASVAELREQLEHAEKAFTDAQSAARAAQDAFDADPSAEKALLAARDAERATEEHLARAKRLLAAAEAAEAEAARQADLARAAELEKALSVPAIQAAGADLARQEAETLRHLVEIRAARLALRDELGVLAQELGVVRHRLGKDHRSTDNAHVAISWAPVAELIDEWIKELPVTDPRRQLLSHVKPEPQSYMYSWQQGMETRPFLSRRKAAS